MSVQKWDWTGRALLVLMLSSVAYAASMGVVWANDFFEKVVDKRMHEHYLVFSDNTGDGMTTTLTLRIEEELKEKLNDMAEAESRNTGYKISVNAMLEKKLKEWVEE